MSFRMSSGFSRWGTCPKFASTCFSILPLARVRAKKKPGSPQAFSDSIESQILLAEFERVQFAVSSLTLSVCSVDFNNAESYWSNPSEACAVLWI